MQPFTVKQLVDNGICPTCYDREHGNCVFGYHPERILYENDKLECFLVGNPRSIGHMAISAKKHYKDMLEIPDALCQEIYVFAKQVMILMKDVYQCESVYLCTMCDGPMNHFHVQLIPRYANEERGSKNFVKTRKEYEDNDELVLELRKKIAYNKSL